MQDAAHAGRKTAVPPTTRRPAWACLVLAQLVGFEVIRCHDRPSLSGQEWLTTARDICTCPVAWSSPSSENVQNWLDRWQPVRLESDPCIQSPRDRHHPPSLCPSFAWRPKSCAEPGVASFRDQVSWIRASSIATVPDRSPWLSTRERRAHLRGRRPSCWIRPLAKCLMIPPLFPAAIRSNRRSRVGCWRAAYGGLDTSGDVCGDR